MLKSPDIRSQSLDLQKILKFLNSSCFFKTLQLFNVLINFSSNFSKFSLCNFSNLLRNHTYLLIATIQTPHVAHLLVLNKSNLHGIKHAICLAINGNIIPKMDSSCSNALSFLSKSINGQLKSCLLSRRSSDNFTPIININTSVFCIVLEIICKPCSNVTAFFNHRGEFICLTNNQLLNFCII